MALENDRLGSTGTQVSTIALGTWRFGESRSDRPDVTEDVANDLLDTYADHGGNFIDTADRYGEGESERWIGWWLETRDRDKFVIASKTGRRTLDCEDLTRKYLRQQVDAILDRLGTDYLDILYAHRWDDDTPPEEFMRTFSEFVDSGRVHYIGISTRHPNAWKVTKANEIADRHSLNPFTVSQPLYNLVDRDVEDNYLEMSRDYDIGVAPFSPLAEGFLTGKYQRNEQPANETRFAREQKPSNTYLTKANFNVLDTVIEIANEENATPAQISLAWLIHHPDVTAPVVGARTVPQLEENLAASEVSLSTDQFDRLSEVTSRSP